MFPGHRESSFAVAHPSRKERAVSREDEADMENARGDDGRNPPGATGFDFAEMGATGGDGYWGAGAAFSASYSAGTDSSMAREAERFANLQQRRRTNFSSGRNNLIR